MARIAPPFLTRLSKSGWTGPPPHHEGGVVVPVHGNPIAARPVDALAHIGDGVGKAAQ